MREGQSRALIQHGGFEADVGLILVGAEVEVEVGSPFNRRGLGAGFVLVARSFDQHV